MEETGFEGRVFPQMSLEFRWPWVRRGANWGQLIEPIAGVYVAPTGIDRTGIPNDDSETFDFDENDLFTRNRFYGRDRIDEGQRVDYGLRTAVFGRDGGGSQFIVGQSYRLNSDFVFPAGSGLDDRLSDIVGRLSIYTGVNFDLSYRFRVDRHNFALQRQEVGLFAGPDQARFAISYLELPPRTGEVSERKQLTVGATVGLTRYWRGVVRDGPQPFGRERRAGDRALRALPGRMSRPHRDGRPVGDARPGHRAGHVRLRHPRPQESGRDRRSGLQPDRRSALEAMGMLRLLFFLVLLAGSAGAQETRIAAVVNEDVISVADLEQRLRFTIISAGIEDTPQTRQRIGPQVLRTMIDEKLQVQEARRLNVKVSEAELAAAITRIEGQNNLPPGGLDKYLKDRGVTRSALEDQVTATIAFAKLVQRRYGNTVAVSDEEVQEALEQLKEREGQSLSRIAEIFLAVDDPRQEDEVRRFAERLVEQIRGGAPFSSVAQQFSQAATAAVGGDIGWVSTKQLAPRSARRSRTCNPGELSVPVRGPGGWYILGILEKRIGGRQVLPARRPAPQPVPETGSVTLVQILFPIAPNAGQAAQEKAAQAAKDVPGGGEELRRHAAHRAPAGAADLGRSRPYPHQGSPAELRQPIAALEVGRPDAAAGPARRDRRAHGLRPRRAGPGPAASAGRTDPERARPAADARRSPREPAAPEARQPRATLRARSASRRLHRRARMSRPLALTMGEPAGIGARSRWRHGAAGPRRCRASSSSATRRRCRVRRGSSRRPPRPTPSSTRPFPSSPSPSPARRCPGVPILPTRLPCWRRSSARRGSPSPARPPASSPTRSRRRRCTRPASGIPATRSTWPSWRRRPRRR